MDGRKDAQGVLRPETSLKQLLAGCTDFKEEESLLQSMGRKMGVFIDQTPKCHCVLAGEGIEYSWDCAKNFYWRISIRQRRKKEAFRDMVRRCLSEEVITTVHIRKPSRRNILPNSPLVGLESLIRWGIDSLVICFHRDRGHYFTLIFLLSGYATFPWSAQANNGTTLM